MCHLDESTARVSQRTQTESTTARHLARGREAIVRVSVLDAGDIAPSSLDWDV
jgi:hypothetical protein